MLPLPLLRLFVVQETTLLLAKGRWMNRPAPIGVLARDELVEHFVKNDIFDHILGDKRLIE